MKKLFSFLLLAAFTTAPMAFAKKEDARKEHYILYHHHVLEPKLKAFQAKIESAQSWKDMEAMLENVTPEHKEQIVAQLKMLEGSPFKLPKLTQTPAGFMYEIQGKAVAIDFLVGEITIGEKKLSFDGKSPDDIFSWFEKNAHTASTLSWIISEAYAFPPDLIYRAILAVYMAVVVPVSNKEQEMKACDTAVGEFHKGLVEGRTQCEMGILDKLPLKYLFDDKYNEIMLSYWNKSWAQANKYSCREEVQKQLVHIKITSCGDMKQLDATCAEIERIKKCVENTVKKANVNNSKRSTVEKVYLKKEEVSNKVKAPFKKAINKVKGKKE